MDYNRKIRMNAYHLQPTSRLLSDAEIEQRIDNLVAAIRRGEADDFLRGLIKSQLLQTQEILKLLTGAPAVSNRPIAPS